MNLEFLKSNDTKNKEDSLKAGTGFMQSLSSAIRKFESDGYDINLVPRYDHFEAKGGTLQFFPRDFQVDKVVRFENTSDPDDQSILYAVSMPGQNLKGLFVESYGVGGNELSRTMIERMKWHE